MLGTSIHQISIKQRNRKKKSIPNRRKLDPCVRQINITKNLYQNNFQAVSHKKVNGIATTKILLVLQIHIKNNPQNQQTSHHVLNLLVIKDKANSNSKEIAMHTCRKSFQFLNQKKSLITSGKNKTQYKNPYRSAEGICSPRNTVQRTLQHSLFNVRYIYPTTY